MTSCKFIISWLLPFLLLGLSPVLSAQEQPAPAADEAAPAEGAPAEGDAETVAEGPSKPPEIYIAAKHGKLKRLQKLIEEGADINATNRQGRTALMSAIQYKNRRIAEELLVEGADVNLKDKLGRTALMLAIHKNDMPLINLLLESGADVMAADNNNRTAFTLAEASKDKELSKLLEAAKPAEAAE